MNADTIITWAINFLPKLIVLVLGFGGFILWDKSKDKNSIRVNLFLDKRINGGRVYWKNLKCEVKKHPKSKEKKLFINKLEKLWLEIPDSRFFSHDIKGNLILRGIHESEGQINWVLPEKTSYEEKEVKKEVPVLDKNGELVYEEKFVLDSNGEKIVIEKESGNKVLKSEDEKFYILYNDKNEEIKKIPVKDEEKYTFDYKTEKVQNFETKVVKELVAVSKEVAIQSDVKMYFLNKNAELNERFKNKDQNELLKMALTLGAIAIIVIASVYMTYKHQKEIAVEFGDEMKEGNHMLVNAINSMTKSNEKGSDYGKKIDEDGNVIE